LNARPDHLSRIEIGEEPTNLEEGLLDMQLFTVRVADNYFVDIIHFLTTGMTPNRYTNQQKELVVCATDFLVIAGHLYNMGTNEILKWYMPDFQQKNILAEAHGGAARGNYARKAKTQKILHAGL